MSRVLTDAHRLPITLSSFSASEAVSSVHAWSGISVAPTTVECRAWTARVYPGVAESLQSGTVTKSE